MTTKDTSRSSSSRSNATALREPYLDDDRSPDSARRSTTRAMSRANAKNRARIAKEPPHPLMEVRSSAIQGRGVFARVDIAKGTRISEYIGERISSEEADRRAEDEDMERHHTFLYLVNDHLVIDAQHYGNDARFINHSCDPNCETFVVKERVWVDAIKDIRAGEELTYDYWYAVDESYTEEDLRRIYPCRCGSPKCRGTLARPREEAAPEPSAKTKTKTKTKTKGTRERKKNENGAKNAKRAR